MLKQKNDIFFRASDHKYFDKEDNKYCSVTTWLSHFADEFIADESKTATTRMALGMTHEQVLDMWERQKNSAARRGSIIHDHLENTLKERNIYLEFPDLEDLVEPLELMKYITFVHKNLEKNNFFDEKYTIIPEDILYSKKYKIAGQSDLVIIGPEGIYIKDYKTNLKHLEMQSYDNKCMEYPFESIKDCDLGHYQVQLSTYGVMAEQYYELPIISLEIFHLTSNFYGGCKTIELEFKKEQIKKALQQWEQNQNK